MKYFLLSIFMVLNTAFVKKPQKKALKINYCQFTEDTVFYYSVKMIKKWEKFSGSRYNLFGDKYIGYGHKLYSFDTITIITEADAEKLLIRDLNQAIEYANTFCPKLAKNKRQFMANFIFNCGPGTFAKSKLYQATLNKCTDDSIESIYYGYIYAGKRHLPKMIERRKDEFKIWR